MTGPGAAMTTVVGHSPARAKPGQEVGFLWKMSWSWEMSGGRGTGCLQEQAGDTQGEQPCLPGQPMAEQELAQGDSIQEGSPLQLSRTCSLAPGANFQELLAAWDSLSCLHGSSFLRSPISSAFSQHPRWHRQGQQCPSLPCTTKPWGLPPCRAKNRQDEPQTPCTTWASETAERIWTR